MAEGERVREGVLIEWAEHLKPMNNSREHRFERSSRVKKQRLTVGLMLRAHRVADRLGPCPEGHRLVVRFTRQASRQVDPGDNLNSCFKSIRDEIAAYCHVNDGRDDLIHFEYLPQLKGPSAVRVLFLFEPYVPSRPIPHAIIETKELATTPKQWHQRGLLKPNVIRPT
jgi:hypothetical protein